jgi:hypothetical protein
VTPAVKCYKCDRTATLLCDGVLHYVGAPASHSGRKYTAIDSSEDAITCDRPMCDRCAVRVGVRFWCGEAGGVDTEDLCQPCSLRKAAGVKWTFVTRERAAALRRERKQK